MGLPCYEIINKGLHVYLIILESEIPFNLMESYFLMDDSIVYIAWWLNLYVAKKMSYVGEKN